MDSWEGFGINSPPFYRVGEKQAWALSTRIPLTRKRAHPAPGPTPILGATPAYQAHPSQSIKGLTLLKAILSLKVWPLEPSGDNFGYRAWSEG